MDTSFHTFYSASCFFITISSPLLHLWIYFSNWSVYFPHSSRVVLFQFSSPLSSIASWAKMHRKFLHSNPADPSTGQLTQISHLHWIPSRWKSTEDTLPYQESTDIERVFLGVTVSPVPPPRHSLLSKLNLSAIGHTELTITGMKLIDSRLIFFISFDGLIHVQFSSFSGWIGGAGRRSS